MCIISLEKLNVNKKLTVALIQSMGMSTIFFKEKVTPKAIVGIVLAFVGLLVMNVL